MYLDYGEGGVSGPLEKSIKDYIQRSLDFLLNINIGGMFEKPPQRLSHHKSRILMNKMSIFRKMQTQRLTTNNKKKIINCRRHWQMNIWEMRWCELPIGSTSQSYSLLVVTLMYLMLLRRFNAYKKNFY